MPGSFRISTTKQGISPKFYGNSWGGNLYTTTYNIGKIGKGLGALGGIAGTLIDVVGVVNYSINPDSSNAIHPAKAGLNLGILGYGAYINPIAPAIYGGLEAFYPGGAAGAMEVQSRNIENNRKIIKDFGPFITGKL